MTDLRYPVGEFSFDGDSTAEKREGWIQEIEVTPNKLRQVVQGLSAEQLDTPYRPDGWTVRQVVHHLADSQLQGYVRFRLVLTEQEPTIKPYFEDRWAKLSDAIGAPIEPSLGLLESLHQRWVLLLRSLSEADFGRTLNHPERGVLNLDANLQLYAWHGRHHRAHVAALRERKGW